MGGRGLLLQVEGRVEVGRPTRHQGGDEEGADRLVTTSNTEPDHADTL